MATTGSLTLTNRKMATSAGGLVTASFPAGTTRVFLDTNVGGWDDYEFPKAISFQANETFAFQVIGSGVVAPPGAKGLYGPYVDLGQPVPFEIPALTAYYVVNVVATENFTLAFDVETLRADTLPTVGFLRVTGDPGEEHQGGHVIGEVSSFPVEGWAPAGTTSQTDLRGLCATLDTATGTFAKGDRILVGGETVDYVVESVSGATLKLNRPLRPVLVGYVSATTDFYATSTIVGYEGNTGEHAPDDPHAHDMTHDHAFPGYRTTIPVDGWTGATLEAGFYVEIRGSVYRVASVGSASIDIDGGLSGPVFDDDPISAMTLPTGLTIQMATWQHRGTFQMAPIEYLGHFVITEVVELFPDEATASSGTALDTMTLKFGRPTPRSTVRVIDDYTVEMQDRTLAPGTFKVHGFGIRNNWGTQTLDITSPGVEFTQPDEPGYRAGI